MDSVKYVGLDVHQVTISAAVLDSEGHLVMQCVLATRAGAILDFLQGLRGTIHLTFEEGTHSAWLYDLLLRRVGGWRSHSPMFGFGCPTLPSLREGSGFRPFFRLRLCSLSLSAFGDSPVLATPDSNASVPALAFSSSLTVPLPIPQPTLTITTRPAPQEHQKPLRRRRTRPAHAPSSAPRTKEPAQNNRDTKIFLQGLSH